MKTAGRLVRWWCLVRAGGGNDPPRTPQNLSQQPLSEEEPKVAGFQRDRVLRCLANSGGGRGGRVVGDVV